MHNRSLLQKQKLKLSETLENKFHFQSEKNTKSKMLLIYYLIRIKAQMNEVCLPTYPFMAIHFETDKLQDTKMFPPCWLQLPPCLLL